MVIVTSGHNYYHSNDFTDLLHTHDCHDDNCHSHVCLADK